MGARRDVSSFVYIAKYVGEVRKNGDFYQYKYKVGWSRNPATRIEAINRTIDVPIKYDHIFYFSHIGYQIELDIKKLFVKYVHNRYRVGGRRLAGESFWAFPEQIDVIVKWLPLLGGIPMDHKIALELNLRKWKDYASNPEFDHSLQPAGEVRED